MRISRYIDVFQCDSGGYCKGEEHCCTKSTYKAPCVGGKYWQTSDPEIYSHSRTGHNRTEISLAHLFAHGDKVMVFQLTWKLGGCRKWFEVRSLSDILLDSYGKAEFYIIPTWKVFKALEENRFDWNIVVSARVFDPPKQESFIIADGASIDELMITNKIIFNYDEAVRKIVARMGS